jgi:hypothetical protein
MKDEADSGILQGSWSFVDLTQDLDKLEGWLAATFFDHDQEGEFVDPPFNEEI